MKKNEQSLREIWDTMKNTNKHAMEIPGREEREGQKKNNESSSNLSKILFYTSKKPYKNKQEKTRRDTPDTPQSKCRMPKTNGNLECSKRKEDSAWTRKLQYD